MKNKKTGPAIQETTVNQVGADVAVQLMLMMLFACVSRLADDSDAVQTQVCEKLLEITEAVQLPPASDDFEPEEVRSAARTVISNVFVGARAIQFPKQPA